MSVFFAASPNANETASQCHSVAASAEKRRGLSTLEARILLSLRLQYSSRQIAVFPLPARKARKIFENNSKSLVLHCLFSYLCNVKINAGIGHPM